MENQEFDNIPQEESYIPRPRWQIWLARMGLVIFVAFLILYYILWFKGGL